MELSGLVGSLTLRNPHPPICRDCAVVALPAYVHDLFLARGSTTLEKVLNLDILCPVLAGVWAMNRSGTFQVLLNLLVPLK